MPVKRFLDTNILLYAYDLDSGEKRDIAVSILEKAWLEPGSIAISVQVLQEFFVNFTRKGQTEADARQLMDDFCHWSIVENSLPLFQKGLEAQERGQLSLWDAMILAAAETSGAAELLSENLNHGQHYGNVQVINPFRVE